MLTSQTGSTATHNSSRALLRTRDAFARPAVGAALAAAAVRALAALAREAMPGAQQPLLHPTAAGGGKKRRRGAGKAAAVQAAASRSGGPAAVLQQLAHGHASQAQIAAALQQAGQALPRHAGSRPVGERTSSSGGQRWGHLHSLLQCLAALPAGVLPALGEPALPTPAGPSVWWTCASRSSSDGCPSAGGRCACLTWCEWRALPDGCRTGFHRDAAAFSLADRALHQPVVAAGGQA